MISLGLNLWSTTILARGGADAYGIGGFSPALVFDFTEEYYRTGGSVSTFDSAMTATRAGNAVMVDESGLLKWAPHNFLSYSEQFDNAAWGAENATVSPDETFSPDGSVTADAVFETATTSGHLLSRAFSGGALAQHSLSVYLKSNGRSFATLLATAGVPNQYASATFDLSGDGGVTQTIFAGTHTSARSGSIVFLGDGWYLCTLTVTLTGTLGFIGIAAAKDGTFTPDAFGRQSYAGDITKGVYAWGAHLYRSDLGGMAANPDTGNSYVPTTSSARYLPRRGHHVWNGTEWVNEGLLVESEARTNLVTHSEDFTAASWIAAGVTKSGASTSVNIVPSTATSPHVLYTASYTVVANDVVTVACDVLKASTYRFFALSLHNGTVTAGNEAVRVFDLSDGSFGNSYNVTPDNSFVEDKGDYWRVGISFAITSTTANVAYWPLDIDRNPRGVSWAGDGVSGVTIKAAQVEVGSTPSSYIPTSGSTVTRAADVDTSDQLTYDATAMWFALSGLETYADLGAAGQVELFDWRVDANNRVTVTLDTDGAETGEITLTVVSGGTSWDVAADYLTPGVNKPFNIAWRVTSTEINLAVGGSAETAVPITSIPDLSAASATLEGMGTRALFRQGVGDVGDAGLEAASA